MVLLRNLINIFSISELRKKLGFTLFILVIYRLGSYIPLVGVDLDKLGLLMKQSAMFGGLFSYLDLFSGGALRQCTIFALGISPYITASLMMQILGMTIPTLEQLLKEGEYGRKIVNQYTRYLALGISILQSSFYVGFLASQGLIREPYGMGTYLTFMLLLVSGSMFVMWLGEQISLFGLGNGSSMLIFAGIVSTLPTIVLQTVARVQEGALDLLTALLMLALFVLITASIVFLEKGERKIPVQYTRRIVGHRVYGGQSTYIPFKINNANIMPVIFAQTLLSVPTFTLSALASRFESFKPVMEFLRPDGLMFSVFTFLFIVFFSFFYTALVFNPEELAENIKKGGGFIPGIRPGRKTAEFFNFILTRIGLVGAIYLGILALLPTMLNGIGIPFPLGGTSLLIVVGVALETASQIEAYLIEHRYEGFLSSGRLKG